jgi:hypothetical protein
MSNVPDFASFDKLYTPRPHGTIRFAQYWGFEGYAAASDDWTILFRTSGSLWKPVLDTTELMVLGEVGEAEAQLALDRCAGGYAAVACSRQNVEV